MCSKYWVTSVLLVCCMCTACWGINKVVFVHFHPLILISLEYSILLLGARSPLSTIMDLQILCCEGIWIQSDPSTNSFTFSKPSSVANSHSQYDRILKKNQQMYALLAICLSLCPHPILVEESVNNQLQENYAEKMLHMHCGDEAMFEGMCFLFPNMLCRQFLVLERQICLLVVWMEFQFSSRFHPPSACQPSFI